MSMLRGPLFLTLLLASLHGVYSDEMTVEEWRIKMVTNHPMKYRSWCKFKDKSCLNNFGCVLAARDIGNLMKGYDTRANFIPTNVTRHKLFCVTNADDKITTRPTSRPTTPTYMTSTSKRPTTPPTLHTTSAQTFQTTTWSTDLTTQTTTVKVNDDKQNHDAGEFTSEPTTTIASENSTSSNIEQGRLTSDKVAWIYGIISVLILALFFIPISMGFYYKKRGCSSFNKMGKLF